MRKDYYENSKDYINRWVISYADFVTMLLALFMVLFALSNLDKGQTEHLKKSLQNTFVREEVKDGYAEEKAEIVMNPNHDKQTGFLPPDELINVINKGYNFDSVIKIFEEPRGITIRINDKMIFDSGSAIIKPTAQNSLDKVAEFLQTIKNPVIIEGHTDSNPMHSLQYPSNWELSTARATNIIKYLSSKHNIDPARMSAVGYGENMPIMPNDTEQGRIANRRVDIVILGSQPKQDIKVINTENNHGVTK